MLTFPDQLKERDGLKLAAALRDGHETKLRDALAQSVCATPAQEAQLIDAAVSKLEPARNDPKRGGRPKKDASVSYRSVRLESGVELSSGHDGQAWVIRLKGPRVDQELVEVAMSELTRLLDAG
jgi:ParB family chromosome partitioning protein